MAICLAKLRNGGEHEQLTQPGRHRTSFPAGSRIFQNSALGDEDRTQERNGEKPVVLDSNATPQWAPAAQRLVIQAPEESPRIVTVGEDERGTALVTAADEQAWTF